MKKKNALAKKVLCSLLAAGVLGVAGSAMAAEITYGEEFTNQNGGKEYKFVSKNAFFNSGTVSIGTAEDNITFKGKEAGAFNTGYNALVVAGNGTKVNVTADTIKVGSQDAGNFRGFRVSGKNNVLTVHANTFVSYTGDEIAHARNGVNTINLGTADKHIGYFEAHTTWGKDDYGVALLQANEGSTVNLYADKAILDGSKHDAGGVIGTGGWGTVNVNVGDLTIDGNICGSYGLMNQDNHGNPVKFIANITADTLNMTGDVNVGSKNTSSSNFARDTEVNITVKDNATITGNINVLGNDNIQGFNNQNDSSTLTIEFNGDSKITGDINVKGSDDTQNATINLGGNGDMTASSGVFNVEKSGNVNFTGGKWAVNKWNSTDKSGDVAIADKATV